MTNYCGGGGGVRQGGARIADCEFEFADCGLRIWESVFPSLIALISDPWLKTETEPNLQIRIEFQTSMARADLTRSFAVRYPFRRGTLPTTKSTSSA